MSDDNETPVAWPATPYRGPVLDAEGGEIGPAESLLGDDSADIFHGIVVGHGGRMLEVPGARVTRITTERVYTDLRPDEIASLQDYAVEPTYKAEWGGLFRRHPKWDRGGGGYPGNR